jgi:hypothetical protein
MNDLLLLTGRAAGIGGVLICAVAAGLRVSGLYWFVGFQLGTLLMMGMAVMIVGCLCFLAVLTERSKTVR